MEGIFLSSKVSDESKDVLLLRIALFEYERGATDLSSSSSLTLLELSFFTINLSSCTSNVYGVSTFSLLSRYAEKFCSVV